MFDGNTFSTKVCFSGTLVCMVGVKMEDICCSECGTHIPDGVSHKP